MITFIIISIWILIWLILDKSISRIGVIFSYLLCLLVLTIWGIEYCFGNISLFKSDEIFYVDNATLGFPGFSDRFLWVLINYWLRNCDIFFQGLSVKLINIPLLAISLIFLEKMFESKKVYFLSLFLPYILFQTTLNLRDIAIMCCTITAIYFYFKSSKIISMIILALLYMLRPFAVFTVFGFIIFDWLWNICKLLNTNKALLRRLFSIIGVCILLIIVGLIFGDIIINRVSRYYAWFLYTTGEGEQAHIEQVSAGFSLGNRIKDFTLSLIRYVLTPMPQSLFLRIIKGASGMWGLVDDCIRLINQIGYYLLLGYFAWNYKWIGRFFSRLKKNQTALFICFLSYWPIYSFHLYGATHQRLKLPFQIVVFLVCMIIFDLKKHAANLHTKISVMK